MDVGSSGFSCYWGCKNMQILKGTVAPARFAAAAFSLLAKMVLRR